MAISVNSETSPQFSELLDQMDQGQEITITRNGVPVAQLVPLKTEEVRTEPTVREAIAWLHEFRKHHSLGGLKIKDLINEGRRF